MPLLTPILEGLLVQAKQIDAFLESKNIPPPSFEKDTLVELPAELQDVRASLANGINDLKSLTRGPVMSAMEIAFSWTDTLALRIIYHFKLANAVPLDGSASYEEIAQKSGLNQDFVLRFVRAGMGNRIFDEDPASGRVRHTAISYLLATNSGFCDALGLQLEELGPAGGAVIDAWEKWGQNAIEPNQTAYSLANQTDLPTFGVLAKNPQRARRFGGAMHFYTADDAWDLRHMLAAFDWASLDRPGARLYDVGGGKGQVSQFIAKNTKSLEFLVQDLPHVVPDATKDLPDEFKERITFTVQNFLEPQKAEAPADAFLLRWVLHNWADEYCVKILQNLIPAMRPGTKVLIYEYVLEDAPVQDLAGRFGPQLDMLMMACYNACERNAQQYKALLEKADKRFHLDTVQKPAGSTMSLVEATWTP